MPELRHVLLSVAFSLVACGFAAPAFAQHPIHGATPEPQPSTQRPPQGQGERRTAETPHEDHAMLMTGALGVPKARAASGTAWLPDLTPKYAVHRQLGDWSAMLHENLFIQYIDEGTDRGDSQFGSVNWVMGMAERRLGGGHFGARMMFSLEPWTVGECGYPDLLATGEFCDGRPLHDRQHPHDFFMEAAAMYERALTGGTAVQLYAALAGEPALGPVAYPHRISALPTPIAPLTHHWLDSTHISYGVVTAGIFARRWKAEASAFNGREPDENRFDLDLAPLDSVSGRVWFVPADRWALQLSRGHLNEAEVPPFGGPRRDVDRTTASVTYHQLVGTTGGFWSAAGAWGRNAEEDHATDALLIETNLGLDSRNSLFARLEAAGKTGEDLVIPALAEESVTVGKFHVGYIRRLSGGMFEPHVGAALSFSAIPDRVEQAYGRDSGFGVVVFFSVRPSAMAGLFRGRRSAVAPVSPEDEAARPVGTGGTVKPSPPADAHGGHAEATATPHAPRRTAQAPELALDPVCGLKVDPNTAPRATHEGQTYHFCSQQHRDLFLKDPAKYLPEKK